MSPNPQASPRERILDSIDRTSEVLFGLILAVSFACSLGTAEAGRGDVKWMLTSAIGCNLAFVLINAVIFLKTSLAERARGLAILREVRATTSPGAAATFSPQLFRPSLPTPPIPSPAPRLCHDDLLAALGIFRLVAITIALEG